MDQQLLYRGSKEVAEQYERILASHGIPSSMGESAFRMKICMASIEQRDLFVGSDDLQRARTIICSVENTAKGRVRILSQQFGWQLLLSVAINSLIGLLIWFTIGHFEGMFFWLFFPGLIVTLVMVSRIARRIGKGRSNT